MDREYSRSSRRILLGIALVLMLASFCAAGCGTKTDESGRTPVSSGGTISTPVGDLTVPEFWNDGVTTEDVSSEEQYLIRFYGRDGEAEALLFELSVGENGTGYFVGNAPDKNGKMLPIWVEIREVEAADTWTEEQTAAINRLQEGVNDLLDQFYSLNGFVKAEN